MNISGVNYSVSQDLSLNQSFQSAINSAPTFGVNPSLYGSGSNGNLNFSTTSSSLGQMLSTSNPVSAPQFANLLGSKGALAPSTSSNVLGGPVSLSSSPATLPKVTAPVIPGFKQVDSLVTVGRPSVSDSLSGISGADDVTGFSFTGVPVNKFVNVSGDFNNSTGTLSGSFSRDFGRLNLSANGGVTFPTAPGGTGNNFNFAVTPTLSAGNPDKGPSAKYGGSLGLDLTNVGQQGQTTTVKPSVFANIKFDPDSNPLQRTLDLNASGTFSNVGPASGDFSARYTQPFKGGTFFSSLTGGVGAGAPLNLAIKAGADFPLGKSVTLTPSLGYSTNDGPIANLDLKTKIFGIDLTPSVYFGPNGGGFKFGIPNF